MVWIVIDREQRKAGVDATTLLVFGKTVTADGVIDEAVKELALVRSTKAPIVDGLVKAVAESGATLEDLDRMRAADEASDMRQYAGWVKETGTKPAPLSALRQTNPAARRSP